MPDWIKGLIILIVIVVVMVFALLELIRPGIAKGCATRQLLNPTYEFRMRRYCCDVKINGFWVPAHELDGMMLPPRQGAE